jgi:PIN domain nuclease of toxin-antitoxin system
MRVLLDTHVLLWALMDHRSLTVPMRREIQAATEVFVSAASIWEIAIKSGFGKISADADAVLDSLEESGFRELPVTARHAARVARLPLHHSDSFDRILVAQAMTEPLILLSADRALARYGDFVRVF